MFHVTFSNDKNLIFDAGGKRRSDAPARVSTGRKVAKLPISPPTRFSGWVAGLAGGAGWQASPPKVACVARDRPSSCQQTQRANERY